MHTWLASVAASEPAQFLLDHMADAVIAVDAELNIRYWNPAAEQIYGWQAAEVLGRSSADVLEVMRYLDGSDPAVVFQAIMTEGVWRGEVVQCRSDGGELIIDAAIHLLRNQDGALIGMVGVNRDVTARHRLEEERRAAQEQAERAHRAAQQHARQAEESRALLESLISAAPVGFAFFDLDHRVQVINERLAACNRHSVEEHLGHRLRELVPGVAAAVEPLVQQVLDTGAPVTNVPLAGDDLGPPWEGKHWLETFYPVVTSAGQPLGVGVVSVEVTELRHLEHDLARSQMQLAGIIDSAMDAIITVDGRQRVVLFNQAAERMFEVPAAEALGASLDRFIPAEHREAHRDHIVAFGRTGSPSGHRADPGAPLTALRADGAAFPVETSISQLTTHGETLYTVILRDVSARLAAERQLRASEANLRAVFDNTAQSFVLLDRDHRVVLWNRLAYERTLEVSGRALVTGASIFQYSVPALVPKMRASFERAAQGEPVHVEYSLGTAEHPFWLSFDYIPVRDGSGEVIGTCITTLDITTQRVALEAITRSEERLRALVGGTSDIVALLGDDLTLRYASPAWERVLGWPPAAWEGRSPLDLVHTDDQPLARQALQQLMRGVAGPSPVTVRLRHGGGSWLWAEVVGADLRGHPAVQGLLLTIRDVTERTRLTAQLLQAQKMESIGRLAGGVAHDFNNLLTAITGYLQLALDGLPPGEPARADIIEADRAARRAGDLTRQLLAFARKQAPTTQACSLNDLIAEMERLLRRLIGEDITLVTELDPALQPVAVDPGQIEQVIVNLAVNARDAMPGGGTLTIRTVGVSVDEELARRLPALRPGDYARISVSDTGLGMDEQVRAHLFEPFFTTKGPSHGTGLGLATCYGLISQHGGAIEVLSEPGAGATFEIYLPQSGVVAPQPAAPSAPARPGGSERVLVVEDEAAVRALATRVLRDHGYTVLEAGDGVEALQVLAAERDVQLVLSDIVMPRLGGQELAARLHAERPNLPVVCMSGYMSDSHEARGGPQPHLRLIQKPFTASTLLQVIREALDLGGG